MNLAFLVPRANHLKIIGSVVTEALRRNHEISFVATPADPKGAGVLAFLQVEFPNVPIVSQMALRQRRFDWAVAVGLRTAPDIRRQTRPRIRWAALDHAGDNLLAIREDPDTTDNWDFLSFLSSQAMAWADVAEGHLAQGYPELDQLGSVIGDKEACRKKWNLPAGRFVVVVGTAARPAGMNRMRRWWFDQYRYWAVMRELRQWADMARATIITKTRAKHGDPAWLTRYCDRIVGDVSFYPFTTLELLRAADLYIGFASAMAIEACAIGVPSVHLYGWPPEVAEWPSGKPFKEEFFIREGGLWNCSGSRSVACYGEDWRFRLHEAIDTVLMERDFKGADSMRIACERWAGPLDGRASARLLNALEVRSRSR